MNHSPARVLYVCWLGDSRRFERGFEMTMFKVTGTLEVVASSPDGAKAKAGIHRIPEFYVDTLTVAGAQERAMQLFTMNHISGPIAFHVHDTDGKSYPAFVLIKHDDGMEQVTQLQGGVFRVV